MEGTKDDPVLDFINKFKSKYPEEFQDAFNHGLCYWFAVILRTRFGGDIYFNPDLVHFTVLIHDHLYDINGINKDTVGQWIEWNSMPNYMDVTSIKESCVYLYDKE